LMRRSMDRTIHWQRGLNCGRMKAPLKRMGA
jgi:hypothetical protein